jgi:hypothetical protein
LEAHGRGQRQLKGGDDFRSDWDAFMADIKRYISVVALSMMICFAGCFSTVNAQSLGADRSLGGYGARMGSAGGSGMSGPVIPYAGRFGGFMPYRMGGSGSLTFESRAGSIGESTRTPLTISPMRGGMSSLTGEMGRQSRYAQTFSLEGAMRQDGAINGSGGFGGPMSGAAGTGVMPPNFGYPFYQPPSLVAPALSGLGMSM